MVSPVSTRPHTRQKWWLPANEKSSARVSPDRVAERENVQEWWRAAHEKKTLTKLTSLTISVG